MDIESQISLEGVIYKTTPEEMKNQLQAWTESMGYSRHHYWTPLSTPLGQCEKTQCFMGVRGVDGGDVYITFYHHPAIRRLAAGVESLPYSYIKDLQEAWKKFVTTLKS